MPRIDWVGMKQEFLSSAETINSFRRRKGLSRDHTYEIAHRDHWMEDRDKIRQKAAVKVQERLIENKAEEYSIYLKATHKNLALTAAFLEKANSTTKERLEAQKTIDLGLRDEKLIRGQPGQITGSINIYKLLNDELSEAKDEPGTFNIKPESLIDTGNDG